MEGKNQGNCSSSSSFTAELFGSKESPQGSSTGVFASIFPPPATNITEGEKDDFILFLVSGRKSSGSDVKGSWQKQSSGSQVWDNKQGSLANSQAASYGMQNKGRNSVFQEESVEPCHLSSSIYYGGQDNYSQSASTQMAGSYPIFEKDGGEDDPNANNPHSASRGNWWQGSLYY